MYIAFPLMMVILLIAVAYIYSLKKQIKNQEIRIYYSRRRLYSAVYNIAWAFSCQYRNAKKSERKDIAKCAAHTVLFVLYPGEGHDKWLEDADEVKEIFSGFILMPQTDLDRQTDRDLLYKTELVQNDLQSYFENIWDEEIKASKKP